jgi:thioredoxin reductase (NADPH)
MITKDIAIIGAGPVGIFASFQAGMLKMSSCIIDALEFAGGQCSALYPEKPIYDIPAFPKILAEDLINNLQEQAAVFNPQYIFGEQVTNIKEVGGAFELVTSKGTIIRAKAVIISAGCGAFGPNRPPLENIEKYEGKSVFYMVKNKEIFRGKKVAIAGGGDSAIDWAISLSDIAEKIYLIHRREKFRCIPSNMDIIHDLVTKGKIELVVPYQLSALRGDRHYDGVIPAQAGIHSDIKLDPCLRRDDSTLGDVGILNKIILSDLDNNIKEIDAEFLLAFFGLATDIGPIKEWGLEYKGSTIIVDPESYETNIKGIYAVGDIAQYPGKLKLILTGFAEVASCLHHAYPRVFDGKALHFEHSTTKGI